jgi:hypothetical protein
VGSPNDTNTLQLTKRGFDVYEVNSPEEAKTRYVADIAGVCNWRGVSEYPSDAELHVFVTKTRNRERVFSSRLSNNTDCPDAFFVEVALALERNWPGGPEPVAKDAEADEQ